MYFIIVNLNDKFLECVDKSSINKKLQLTKQLNNKKLLV